MRLIQGVLAGALIGGCSLCALADVKLASPFTDNMVLQRELAVPVWGTAAPGEKVAVLFGTQAKQATASESGKWMVKLDPLQASSKPAEMVVKGSNEITLKNILVGEVWVCSGQSNMEMAVRSVKDAGDEIAGASRPLIRLFHVNKSYSPIVQDSVSAVWEECSPKTVAGFSAVGYFFGRELNERLDIPVGLIESDWGGTPAQAWTPIEYLSADPELAHYAEAYKALVTLPKEEIEKQEKIRKSLEESMKERAKDSGNKGEADGWQKPGIDLSSWETVSVPTGWFKDKNLYGSVWFRRDVELPESWAGKGLVLSLGIIDDFDTVYFNGEKVGSTGNDTNEWWTVERKYKVPASIVKPGKNTVAVRVFNDYMSGGFLSSAGKLNISIPESNEFPVSVGGNWSRKVESAIKTFPLAVSNVSYNQNSPAFLYNAMLAPVIPYGIRGAIWYQGESNAGRAIEYRNLFPTMINAWREKWGQGPFPFYFVQLANYMAVKDQPSESSWAMLREAQSLTLSKSFNSGMAVIIDIGEAKDIHPKNKQDVGLRLALNALAQTYGMADEYSGPVCKSMRVEGSSIRLFFDHIGDGLEARGGGSLKGFAICGADKKFVWADAKIDGDSILVSNPEVKSPVAVRYAWADNPDCNLCNEDGLPASPFRTDSF